MFFGNVIPSPSLNVRVCPFTSTVTVARLVRANAQDLDDLQVGSVVAGGLDAPLREVGRNVARREPEALAVSGAALQLVGGDVGEPLLERLRLDGVDATLRRLLSGGR